jgi:L-rhamnose isomerase
MPNLFKDTYMFREDGEERAQKTEQSLHAPWQEVDVISSNCPKHIGVKLAHLGDNKFKCPKGHELYKAKGSVSNQTNKDRYDMGIDFRK